MPGAAIAHETGPGGAAPPLVLLHGAGGSAEHWPPEIRSLPGRRVLAVDLPGHGAAPGAGERSVAAYARAVADLLGRRGAAPAVVVGHSLGGAIALALALDFPALVAGLVLVGTGARLRVSPAILEAAATPDSLAGTARIVAGWSFGPGVATAAVEELARRLAATAPGLLHGDFAACDAFDAMDRLGEIRVPTLVVCGTEDRLTPPKYSAVLAQRIAGARLESIADAGHMAMLEDPAAVAAAISAFLATVPATRAT